MAHRHSLRVVFSGIRQTAVAIVIDVYMQRCCTARIVHHRNLQCCWHRDDKYRHLCYSILIIKRCITAVIACTFQTSLLIRLPVRLYIHPAAQVQIRRLQDSMAGTIIFNQYTIHLRRITKIQALQGEIIIRQKVPRLQCHHKAVRIAFAVVSIHKAVVIFIAGSLHLQATNCQTTLCCTIRCPHIARRFL